MEKVLFRNAFKMRKMLLSPWITVLPPKKARRTRVRAFFVSRKRGRESRVSFLNTRLLRQQLMDSDCQWVVYHDSCMIHES